MNLDELQSIQSRERQASGLQNLRPTFYQDAGEFIQELVRERDRTAERADDPFASPEVRRLTDDIETAKSTVEAIYERRVGKVVKTASIAAAGMPADDEGLTDEEAELFDHLVEEIERNRERVLDGVLEGDGSDLSCARGPAAETADPDPEPTGDAPEPETTVRSEPDAAAELGLDPSPEPTGDDGVSAADMMGDGNDDRPTPPEVVAASASDTAPEPPDTHETPPEDATEGEASVERTTVRITRDVGEVFGVDERSYDLSSDDVVTLPAENAGPLVERDAAERLD
ncbi:hypothetical protein [Halosegnis marinus]|uniref:DNA replication factor GINS n=1 Tax=Halosegnis marinus TaxID=3034023 RepID=A0ABD5ZKD9_9EURY|nr:hypothetical protein [Halosegnis sp. DT85]